MVKINRTHHIRKRGIGKGKVRHNPFSKVSYAGEKLTMSEIKSQLAGFTGTEHYYKEYMGLIITDGVKHLEEIAKCGWLVSDAAVILKMELKAEPFVVLKIKVADKKAVINYEDGNNKKLRTQKYQWTDFPEGELSLYYSNGVMMLTSEY